MGDGSVEDDQRAWSTILRSSCSVLRSPFSLLHSQSPIRQRVNDLSNGLLAVVLAPTCVACGTILDVPLGGPVCPSCWRAIVPITPPVCRTCGDALPTWRGCDFVSGACARCRRQPPAVACARAAGAYEGVLRQLIHCLKYEGRRTLAVRLGEMMRERGGDVLDGADFVVPVPLHWRRQHRRGFNQAEDLARWLGPPVVRALRRVHATSPQFGLTASRRRRNVRGAFAPPRRGFLRRRRYDSRLRNACVVLVDDVSTTGATLQACAEALKGGGAREVRAITAARALSTQR
jgi:ComF family protein